jgi:DNA-directed RNA polymerase subunit beta
MVKELQALCLDIRVLDENGETVDISGVIDDDAPVFNNIEDVERSVDAENEKTADGEDEDFDDDFADDDGEFYDDEEYDFDENDDFADDEE